MTGGRTFPLVVAAALSASVLAPLNSTMIVVALPSMLADLDASLTWGSWIIISYLVAMAAVQPLGGALGDRYGRRRMMLVGLGGFAVASVLAVLAPNVVVLIIARTLQAVTGASAIPNGSALVRTLLPADAQGRAFGLISAGVGVALVLGAPLGGIVTDLFGWRWIFMANLVVLAPGLLWVTRLPRQDGRPARAAFDLGGAGLVLLTLVAMTSAVTVWRVPGVPWPTAIVLAVVAAVAGASLRRHLRRVPAPVLDLGLFARPGFLAAGLSVAFIGFTMYTVFLAIPVFLTQMVVWDASDIGLLLVGQSVLMMVFGPIGGWLSDRYGRRGPALAGALVTALGTLPLVAITDVWSWPTYLGALMVIGTGIGLATAPVFAAAMQAARAGAAGQAAGLFSTMRYLGSILGTAGMAAILGSTPSQGSFQVLFAVACAAALAAAVASARLPQRVRPAVAPVEAARG